MELCPSGRLDGRVRALGDFDLLRNVGIGRRRSRRQDEASGDKRRLREGWKIKSEHLILHLGSAAQAALAGRAEMATPANWGASDSRQCAFFSGLHCKLRRAADANLLGIP
jgi:hypothetical protein